MTGAAATDDSTTDDSATGSPGEAEGSDEASGDTTTAATATKRSGTPSRRPPSTRDDRDESGELTDDALMIRLQEGDASAYDRLVHRYSGPLTGYFTKKLRDRSLAEDLVQETLLKLHNRHWDYIPQGVFKRWLFTIARNLTIDTVRRQSRDVVLAAWRGGSEDEGDRMARLAGSLLPPDDVAFFNERADALDRLIDELPDVQRETLVLHYYNGVPLPEVAQIMETNTSTCKSRLRLAREKLLGRVQEAGLVEPP